MTDNEEVPGGELAGWNLTRIPGIIHGAGAEVGLLAQLSRPQLKHLADSLAAEQLLCGGKTLVEITDVDIKPESVRNATQF